MATPFLLANAALWRRSFVNQHDRYAVAHGIDSPASGAFQPPFGLQFSDVAPACGTDQDFKQSSVERH
jgi:hypothetical protein